MKITSTQNQSFKGRIIVKGDQDKLLQIAHKIAEKSGVFCKSCPNFSFETLPLDGGIGIPSTEVLYATGKKDIAILGNMVKDSEKALNGLSFVEKEVQKWIDKNLSKYFKSIKTLKANAVLKAMDEKKFNFYTFEIKK